MRRLGIAAALVLSVLAAPAHAQEQPYYHCQAWLDGEGFSSAIWAHVQTSDWRTSDSLCRDLEQSSVRASPGYRPAMLGYRAERYLDQPVNGVELTACWGQADDLLLVITVLGAPVQAAAPWCDGLGLSWA